MSRLGWIVAAIVLGVPLVFLLYPPQQAARAPGAGLLPWQAASDGQGGSTVLGIKLGESVLAEAEATWKMAATLSLFRDSDGTQALEAFFDNLRLAGLKADVVLTLDLPKEEFTALVARGRRPERSSPEVTRLRLDPADLPAARGATIAALTYLPAVDLAPELLVQRFGEPAERIDADDIAHWLYPARGLAVSVRTQGKELLQFIAPRDFARLRTALEKGSEDPEVVEDALR